MCVRIDSRCEADDRGHAGGIDLRFSREVGAGYKVTRENPIEDIWNEYLNSNL
jgi:hypothetical protein